MDNFILVVHAPPFYIPKKYKDYVLDRTGGGRGSFGEVKKFDCHSSSIAIKKFTNDLDSSDHNRQIMREISLFRGVKHANIVSLLELYRVPDNEGSPDSYYQITEYGTTSLEQKIQEGQYWMDDVKKWMRELLRAVQQLHAHGEIHGSLRPSNICISTSNQLKLQDFGRLRKQRLSSEGNSQRYLPIEQLIGWASEFNEKTDMWTISVILCELISGTSLFSSTENRRVIKQQIECCGPVDPDVLEKVTSKSDVQFLVENSMGVERKNFLQVLRETLKPGRCISMADIQANQDELEDFIKSTLQFDPPRRMMRMHALSHPLLQIRRPWEQDMPREDEEVTEEVKARLYNMVDATSVVNPPIAHKSSKSIATSTVIRKKAETASELAIGSQERAKIMYSPVVSSSPFERLNLRKLFEIHVPKITFYIPEELIEKGYRLDSTKGLQGVTKKFDAPDLPSLVIKQFASPFQTKDRALQIFREMNLLRTMQHPNIVRLVDKYSETETIYHITLYCGIPLSAVISYGAYDMQQVKMWMRELLSALQYIHLLDTIHRNLHPDRICISPTDTRLTLLGFGKARIVDKCSTMTEMKDNSFYMPIEMHVKMSRAYDETVDIWGMAVIFCEMVTGTKLFTYRDGRDVKNVVKIMIEYCGGVPEDIIVKICDNIDQECVRTVSRGMERKDFQEFLRGMCRTGRNINPQGIDNEAFLNNFIDLTLQHDARARMSAEQALAHPFLNPFLRTEEINALKIDENVSMDTIKEHIWNMIHST